MKTEVKQEKCQVSLKVTLDAEEVKGIVGKVERAFVNAAELPGFRKGKAPIQVVRKAFAEKMMEEKVREMIGAFYPEAIKAEKIDEVALANVSDVAIKDDEATFTALVDVKPVFKLPTYKGLKIAQKDVKIDDAQVTEQIARLRAAYAKYEDAKEGDVVEDGDFVQIDYEGMVGKQKIVEINAEAKVVGEGKGFWTQVEEGRFLPEILEALKGMKIGETKEGIKAKFAKDAAPEGLKGAKAVYTVKLTSLRKRILPNDEEFAKKAGAESLEKLTADIRSRMEKNAVEQETARSENAAVELLMKKVTFDVPDTQVERARNAFLQQYAERAQRSGIDADYIKEHQEEILKQAQETAEGQVRLWYVIDAIAAAEKIEASDDDRGKKVIEFILANAKK